MPFAKSLIDYIFRYLGIKFLPKEDQEEIFGPGAVPLELIATNPAPETGDAGRVATDNFGTGATDAPTCEKCGSMMFRAGSCYTCPNCFATTGVCN